MSRRQPKLPLAAAFTTLLLLAFAVGCKGFFVNSPTAVTVSPSTVSLTQGQSQQLTAQATFDSGSPSDVTSSAVWNSSNGCAVSVSTSPLGKITAIGSGSSVTITATFNGVSGSSTITVPTGISISPCGTFNSGTNQVFTATLSGSDVTNSSTWTSSNTSIVNFPNTSQSTATFGPTRGTATITANNGSSTGQLLVTVQ
jgi:hypothetical protein